MGGLAAVILAAGASSRMGRFKPLLVIDGRTMVQRVVDSMRNAGADPVVVVTGYQAEQLCAHLSGQKLTFVHNSRYYDTQMTDSLLLGLAALPAGTSRVLVAPADVPLVKAETISALLATPGAFIRPVHGSRGGHPALIEYSLYPLIKEYAGTGGLRGAAAAYGIQVVDVPVNDPGATLDGDTQAGYEQLLQYNRTSAGRPQPLQLELRLGIQAETIFWTDKTAQFLELIDAAGTVSAACRCMHIPCAEGWAMVCEMERQLGHTILRRNGDGSVELEPEGRRLLAAWRAMEAELQDAGKTIFKKHFHQI